jgi:predicted DNA binding CopG/RHH family protein
MAGLAGCLFGMDVYVDPDLPDDRVEFHHKDGRVDIVVSESTAEKLRARASRHKTPQIKRTPL